MFLCYFFYAAFLWVEAIFLISFCKMGFGQLKLNKSVSIRQAKYLFRFLIEISEILKNLWAKF